jgi:hypothetical protein
MSQTDSVTAFEQWALTALDEHKLIDGKPVPLLTTLLYGACQGDQERFTVVLQALEKAFNAGIELGVRAGHG